MPWPALIRNDKSSEWKTEGTLPPPPLPSPARHGVGIGPPDERDLGPARAALAAPKRALEGGAVPPAEGLGGQLRLVPGSIAQPISARIVLGEPKATPPA